MIRFFKGKVEGFNYTVKPVVDVLNNVLGFNVQNAFTDGLVTILMIDENKNQLGSE